MNACSGDLVNPQLSTFSVADEKKSATVQSDQTTRMDSPNSLPDEGKAPLNADSNDMLESFKTAVDVELHR